MRGGVGGLLALLNGALNAWQANRCSLRGAHGWEPEKWFHLKRVPDSYK